MTTLKKTGYVAGLDGWRALSILGVLLNHANAFSFRGHVFSTSKSSGWLGVYVFFAISGFLICTRILEEEELLGRVNLKQFYLRRVFRIQPAAIVLLGVVALLMLVGWFSNMWRYWFSALFLFRNYMNDMGANHVAAGTMTGPFWTLAIEEHFYLAVSLLLFFARSRRVLLLTILYFSSAGWSLFCLLHWPAGHNGTIFRHTFIQLQFFLPAAIFAVLLRRPNIASRVRYWLHPWTVIWTPLACTVVSVSLRKVLGPAWLGAHHAVSRLLLRDWDLIYIQIFVLWIVATTLHPESWTTRLLELPPLRWLGRLSYSIYLWHVIPYFGLVVATGAVSARVFGIIGHAPWTLLTTVALACGSFYLVERPLMRLGHRLAPPGTPGRMDMQDEPSVEAAIEAAAV